MSYIRNQWKAALRPYLTKCMCESGVNPQIVDEFYQHGQMSGDTNWKCNLRCYAFQTAVMNSGGDVDVKRWSNGIYMSDLQLTQKCDNITEPDLCQKDYLMVRCVQDGLSARYPP